MLRIAWLAIMCACAAGCVTRADPPPAASRAPTGCGAVALTRMNDAAANNYDPETQQIIYRGTYQDCLTWQGKARDIDSIPPLRQAN